MTQRLLAWADQYVDIPGRYAYGRKLSPLFAAVAAIAIAVIETLELRQAILTDGEIWSLGLILVALLVISHAIEYAFSVADKFIGRLHEHMPRLGSERFFQFHRELMDNPVACVSGLLFAMLGVFVAMVLPDKELIWRFLIGFCVSSVFYFTGIGIWAIYLVTKAVRQASQAASKLDELNIYHADGNAGIGYIKDYADTASLLLTMGILALPLAYHLASDADAATGAAAGLSLIAIAFAVLTWLAFTVLASLGGRLALSRVLGDFKTKSLNETALERTALVSAATYDQAEAARLDAKEQAILRIRTGVLSGAGGWKDAASLTAGVVTLMTLANDVYAGVVSILDIVLKPAA